MDEQIVPKHGDYIVIKEYQEDDMRFSTVVRCTWRSSNAFYFPCFGVEADNGDANMTVIREERLDTHMHNGWRYRYMWVAETDKIPVNQMGVS